MAVDKSAAGAAQIRKIRNTAGIPVQADVVAGYVRVVDDQVIGRKAPVNLWARVFFIFSYAGLFCCFCKVLGLLLSIFNPDGFFEGDTQQIRRRENWEHNNWKYY